MGIGIFPTYHWICYDKCELTSILLQNNAYKNMLSGIKLFDKANHLSPSNARMARQPNTDHCIDSSFKFYFCVLKTK